MKNNTVVIESISMKNGRKPSYSGGKKKIFITGGMGYLGSHLAREALKKGYDVMLYDSLIYEQDHAKMLREIGNAKFVIGDTRNIKLLTDCFEEYKPNYVVHFGEFSGIYASDHNPRLTFENNYLASKSVFEVCEKLGIKVLWNSSSSVYGTQMTDKLMTEDDLLPKPIDNYVKHKLLLEAYIKTRPNLKIIAFRPATVFGIAPRIRIDLMPNHFTYMAIDKGIINIFDGVAHRACIDIDELTKGYLKVIEKGNWKHTIYNIGHHNMTKKEYSELIRKVVNCKIGHSSGLKDPRNLQIDCSRFNEEFGFRPKTSYENSIRKVEKWIRDNKKIIEENRFTGILTMPLSEWQRMCS